MRGPGSGGATHAVVTGSVIDLDPAPLTAEPADPTAVKRFYDHYRPLLERRARREGALDPEGVADLAFFDGLRAAPTLDRPSEEAFRAYLYTALRSRIIAEKRRKTLDLDELARVASTQPTTPDPAEGVADGLLTESLLDALTVEQRRVIHDRFYHGYSTRETAERVGKSDGAVRKLQHDAIRRLRRRMAVLGLLAAAAIAATALVLTGSTRNQRVITEGPVDRPIGAPVERPDRTTDGDDGITPGPPPEGGGSGTEADSSNRATVTAPASTAPPTTPLRPSVRQTTTGPAPTPTTIGVPSTTAAPSTTATVSSTGNPPTTAAPTTAPTSSASTTAPPTTAPAADDDGGDDDGDDDGGDD